MIDEFRHYKQVVDAGYGDQLAKILESDVEIEPAFLGFLDTYEALAKIIPPEWTVIDLGSYAGVQAIYFLEHFKYIGVDASPCPKFETPNSIYYHMSISEFIDKFSDIDVRYPIFAICNYVPLGLAEAERVRKTFRDLYYFYPKS